MNTVGIALIWCAVQVTLLGLVAGGLYLLFRRMRPAAAGLIVLAGLMTVVILSFLALSPWPRWTIGRSRDSAQSAVTSANNSLPLRNDSAQEMSPIFPLPMGEAPKGYPGVRAASPLAGDSIPNSPGSFAVDSVANSPLPLGEAPKGYPGVRETQPSAAALLWQAIVEDLSRPQSADPENARRWPAVVAMLLMAAMLCGLGWLVLGVVAVRRQRSRGRPVLEGKLLELVDVLRAELGCIRPVEIRQCDDLATAATVGWRRPVILLPADWQTWTVEQRYAVLAHEIAHARSRDFPALFCGQIALVLHFYHPLVHWLMNRLRLEQELAADAAAASVSGGQRQYLTTIAELALRKQDRPLLWPARTFLPTRNTFLRRIAMLRDSKLRFDRLSPFVRFATIGAVLLCGLFVAGLRGPGVSAPVLADEPKQPAAAAGVEKAVEIAKNESNKSFVARLPSGITVELLGVSENPSKDKPWWRPDGTPLAERPYESLNSVTYSDQPHVAREFAVLVGNLPSEPVGTKLEFDPTYDAAGGGTPKLLDPYKGELHAMAVSLPDQPTVTVRFAVADGPWETVIENRGSTAMGTTKGGFIFSRPVETQLPNSDARVILISITHEIIDDETRVAAVGTDGQEHLASSSTGSGAHNFIQITAEFSKIALKDIKVFRLQKREYKWVEFRNVSLQAGQKTDVQIVLPDKDAHVETRRPTYTQSQNEPRGPVLIFEVDPRSDPSRIPVSDMNKLLNVIERRVNPDSKKIARIRIVEQSKFEVAMLDRNEAEADRVQRLLERSGRLEFRILANTRDNKSLIERALKEPDKNVIKDSEGKREAWWVPIWEDQENKVISKDIAVRERKVDKKKVTEVLVLQDKYNVTNDYLDHAGPGQDQSGRPAIEFSLNSQGGKLFGMLTGDNKPDQVTGFQRKLGIILDDHLFSAPGLRSQIFDRGVIEGSFTKQDVADLTDVLNSGSLPVWFRLVRKQSADTEADKEASKNNLKHLALAMHMYLDRYKRFPPAALYNPAGTTLSSNTTPHSWRVALLPLLGQEELYKQYHLDEPWDSPNNRKLLNKMPDVYRGPTDKFGSTNASYFALVGQGTMFDGKDGTRIQEVRDGTSNTILLVEAKRDIPWTKPEDIAYDSDKPLPELGGYFDYGFHTVFADGSVHFIPKTVSENVMRLLINKNDGQPVQLPPEAR